MLFVTGPRPAPLVAGECHEGRRVASAMGQVPLSGDIQAGVERLLDHAFQRVQASLQ